MQVKPVILCGGAGTRLWPLSTHDAPKQFQSLTSAETMIGLTSSRLRGHHQVGVEIGRTLVVGSKRHQNLLSKQLPDADLILEPFGRNSAPAVAAACLSASPDDLILVLPADHHIEKPERFLEAISIGQDAANDGSIVTFGIEPTYPATGYGYIQSDGSEAGVHNVLEFVEKPARGLAEQYLKKGNYFWNAGIFLFRSAVMLDALERHVPDILNKLRLLVVDQNEGIWDLDPETFSEIEDISIDYAIMERESNIKVVPVNMGWSDVGGYGALWDMFSEHSDANVRFGPVIVQQAKRNFVRSDGPLVAISGVSDLAIVAKDNIVMIAPKDNDLAVKALGKSSLDSPQAASISDTTSAHAKNILQGAFDKWEACAWDPTSGGFVECLELDGSPDYRADRRVRVQARQVYSFAKSIKLNLNSGSAAAQLVLCGVDYLATKCRSADGGWVHGLAPDGDVTNPTKDLYDHAFIILAGAAAYDATGNDDALNLSREALEFIDSTLADPVHGGYFENLENKSARRANPHMHLLEAFLELYAATKEQEYLDRASAIVSLFERSFFDVELNILREHFAANWQPAPGDNGRLFEPGHHYEWATLLAMHARLTGRDTESWRRRLIKKADDFGRHSLTGLALNSAFPDGVAIDNKSRIWPQLELFRARLYHPETSSPGDADRIFDMIRRIYLDPMPEGTWIDEVDTNLCVTSRAVPASILYHLVTAFKPALR